MGRIKSNLVKKTGQQVIKTHKNVFSNDFDNNKKVLDKVSDIPSKKLRNVLAGYVVKLMKKREKDVVLD
ncbi:MAG: 30S ribosomal protein S17e [Candidatus Nanoarchaeia archaeon]|nr:30S ribosomal protein S17e [Candidatus Nanoarchaeia archaeon]